MRTDLRQLLPFVPVFVTVACAHSATVKDAGALLDASVPDSGEPIPSADSGVDAGTSVINGFATGPLGCSPLSLSAGANVGGYMVDRYAWSDSACTARTAALVRNIGADPGGTRGGYLRELTWKAGSVDRTARGTGANGWNGWGYVVNHYGSTADLSRNKTGTYRTVLSGPHHALHEFKVRMNPGGPVDATLTWFFATGKSHPVVAVKFDATPAGANVVNADTRTPYGDFAFEGTAGPIGGIAWGDKYRFTTTGTGPVTTASAWDYTQGNLVPFVQMWAQTIDAEMGAVATQTFAAKPAGGDYGGGLLTADCWGKTSANKGSSCAANGETMPQSWLWPFQLNQYELPFTDESHRLAWGSTYGAVGKTSVSAFGTTISGYPSFGYSVYFVVGRRSTASVAAQVTQVERHTSASLSATVGTLPRYDSEFGTFDVVAANSAATVLLRALGGPIEAPTFRVTGFSKATLSQVTLNGTALTAGTGYFSTVDAANATLWLTLNGTVTSDVTLHVE